MEPCSKKRKVDIEGRTFNDSWTEKYFFTNFKNKPTCLICKQVIAVIKEYNIQRHYSANHQDYKAYSGQIRKDKVQSLKRELSVQQNIFSNTNSESEKAVRASFAISKLIAKKYKPFTDGEFIKECVITSVQIMCPEKQKLFENISLSRMTISRRIENLSTDLKLTLEKLASEFEYYSLALDESTDATDTAEIAVFVRGIDSNFNLTEELANLHSLHDTTTGVDIYKAVMKGIDVIGLKLHNLCGVTTDGAPSMIGREKGFVALLEKERINSWGSNVKFVKVHCIIHQENLCSKSIRMQNVMEIVVKTVNFIRARGLNHRQFRKLLDEMDSQYGDLLYYTEVRWLSRGAMLRRFYELRDEVFHFMEEKGKPVFHLKDPYGCATWHFWSISLNI